MSIMNRAQTVRGLSGCRLVKSQHSNSYYTFENVAFTAGVHGTPRKGAFRCIHALGEGIRYFTDAFLYVVKKFTHRRLSVIDIVSYTNSVILPFLRNVVDAVHRNIEPLANVDFPQMLLFRIIC